MDLIFTLFASLSTVIERIIIVSQWRVWRVIFHVFPNIFLLIEFFFFKEKSDNNGSRSGSSVTCTFPLCYVNYVGRVSGGRSGVFDLTKIKSIDEMMKFSFSIFCGKMVKYPFAFFDSEMVKCSFPFCDGEIVNCSFPFLCGEMVKWFFK